MVDGSNWNDARWDELAREVDRLRPLALEQERLSGNIKGLRSELGSTKKEVEGLREDIKTFIGNPIVEARQRKSALFVSLIAAIGGGAFMYAISILSGAPLH